MKKWFVGIMVAAFIITCSLSIYAQQGKFHDGQDKFHNGQDKFQQDRRVQEDAHYILHRTAMVLLDAQQASRHGHHNLGLARVFAHQQKAQELYSNGSYRDAIFFSLQSRELAFKVLDGNGVKPRREFYRDEMEERYRHDSPRDEELDRKVDSKRLGRDDDVVRIHIDFDIK
jgi:hypothetical protein